MYTVHVSTCICMCMYKTIHHIYLSIFIFDFGNCLLLCQVARACCGPCTVNASVTFSAPRAPVTIAWLVGLPAATVQTPLIVSNLVSKHEFHKMLGCRYDRQ